MSIIKITKQLQLLSFLTIFILFSLTTTLTHASKPKPKTEAYYEEARARYEACDEACDKLRFQKEEAACRRLCKDRYDEEITTEKQREREREEREPSHSEPSHRETALERCWKECEDRDEGLQTKFCKKQCETEHAHDGLTVAARAIYRYMV